MLLHIIQSACHKCGEKGHIHKDCPKKTSNNKPKMDSTPNPSMTAIPTRVPMLVHITAFDGEEISSSESLLMAFSH